MDFGTKEKEYLERLYSFDKRGKLRVFEAWLENTDDDIVVINVSSGYKGGKMSNKKTYVRKSFQKRSILQQAVLEMQSKISTKMDEGYKTAEMYMDKYYDGKNPNGSEELFMEAVTYNDLIPKYDSNRDWIPRPMLADKYKPKKNGDCTYLIQPKLDGVRCLALLKDGKITLMSRGGNYYYMPHLTTELMLLFDKIINGNKDNWMFDGELYIHNVSFEKISGLCRLGLNQDSVQSSLIDEKSIIEYHIYDVFSPDVYAKEVMNSFGKPDDIIQHARTGMLLSIQERCPHLNNIKFVDTELVESEEAIQEYHDEVVADGYEGAILRNPQGIYEPGVRSKDLLKVKRFKEGEFRIVGYKIDPAKTVEDSFVFQLHSPNGDFHCRPKGTAALKRKYHQDIDKLIGKRATVRYLDTTNTGLPGKAHVKTIRNYE